MRLFSRLPTRSGKVAGHSCFTGQNGDPRSVVATDALKLSCASGIPIEKLAGEAFDQLENAVKAPARAPSGRSSKS